MSGNDPESASSSTVPVGLPIRQLDDKRVSIDWTVEDLQNIIDHLRQQEAKAQEHPPVVPCAARYHLLESY
jgi:hypothetical protein